MELSILEACTALAVLGFIVALTYRHVYYTTLWPTDWRNERDSQGLTFEERLERDRVRRAARGNPVPVYPSIEADIEARDIAREEADERAQIRWAARRRRDRERQEAKDTQDALRRARMTVRRQQLRENPELAFGQATASDTMRDITPKE